MREYRPYKHQMGVEGPSFWREQQARREQEAEAQAKAREKQGRDQPKSPDPAPKPQPSMWDFLPHAGPAPTPPQAQEPAFQRRGYGSVDPNQWLQVPAIWNYVGQIRAQPQYRGESFIVDVLTPAAPDLDQTATEIYHFFRMTAASFQGLNLEGAWKQVIGPFLESLEAAMNRAKPFTITGQIRFEIDEEGKLVLVYQDR